MELYFYGAGKRGTKALEVFQKHKEEDLVFKGYIESMPKGSYKNGYRVYELSEIALDADIVITVADVHVVVEIYEHLKMIGYSKIFYYSNQMSEGSHFLEKYCQSCADWGNCVLPQAEVHVSDYCNLNCRGCTHYSPIFERVFPDTDRRIQDIRLLKEKFSHIVEFYLLGGEPLLNPDIVEYIERTREIMPHSILTIVTNGLLLPKLSEGVFHALRENNYIVSISEYEPTHRIIAELEKILDNYHINYMIRPFDAKQKFNKPLALSEKSGLKNLCISNGCVNIYNGKIARCPSLMYIDKLNERFGINLPNDGIYPLDDTYSGKQLKELLRREVPLCKHCVENSIEWRSCGIEAKLSDFVETELA